MMTMTTSVAVPLNESLQALVDSRLDTIDRMLMGRVPRQDRLSIVREVEAQVFDLLQERDGEDLSREDVLAVLARLDPPEAYLPEETDVEPRSPRMTHPRTQAVPSLRKGDPRIAKLSGIIGLVTLAVILLSPLDLLVAMALPSDINVVVFYVLGAGSILLTLIGATSAVVLGITSRMATAWAVVGLVASVLALLFAVAAGLALMFGSF